MFNCTGQPVPCTSRLGADELALAHLLRYWNRIEKVRTMIEVDERSRGVKGSKSVGFKSSLPWLVMKFIYVVSDLEFRPIWNQCHSFQIGRPIWNEIIAAARFRIGRPIWNLYFNLKFKFNFHYLHLLAPQCIFDS